jgi:hypothetical protein
METVIVASWAAVSTLWTVWFWGSVLIRRRATPPQAAQEDQLGYVPPPV